MLMVAILQNHATYQRSGGLLASIASSCKFKGTLYTRKRRHYHQRPEDGISHRPRPRWADDKWDFLTSAVTPDILSEPHILMQIPRLQIRRPRKRRKTQMVRKTNLISSNMYLLIRCVTIWSLPWYSKYFPYLGLLYILLFSWSKATFGSNILKHAQK